jgi:AcrR family transcriptional regulator
MAAMRHEFGSQREPGVLGPTLPMDIGAHSQRQRILEAIAKSCAEKTFAATTISDIVANAGISRATFYKHFTNKRECFEATAHAFVDKLKAVAEERMMASANGNVVHEAAEAVLAQLAAYPEGAKLLLIEAPIVEPMIIGRCREMAIVGLQSRFDSNGSNPKGADPGIAFGRAQVVIADYIASGRTGDLPKLASEMVYVALLPFLGHAEALEQAQLRR